MKKCSVYDCYHLMPFDLETIMSRSVYKGDKSEIL